MELKGTYTALITPFRNEKVDFEGLRKNIQFQIKNGITGIVVLGTTGETPTLTPKEQIEIIKVAIDEVKGKIPIMVGTGTNNTQKTIENTREAKLLGADMVLIMTPYYNKPTDEGIFRHFKAVSDSVSIPIIAYNIPGRTSKNIETQTLKRISELENVIGVKEASGNVNQMMDVIHSITTRSKNFSIVSGDDSLTLPLMALGGKGIISVVSNLVPTKMVEMVNAALDGNFSKAKSIHYELLPLFKGAFIETNPIPIKEAMNMCGMRAGGFRLPLCEMLPENRTKLKKILEDMKLI